MVVLLTISAGLDTGPFDIYSNVDDFTTPVETGVSKALLVAGYNCSSIPDGATTVMVKSVGDCTNYAVSTISYPTPPSTPSPTTTPSSTPAPTPTPTLGTYSLDYIIYKEGGLCECVASSGSITVNGTIIAAWDATTPCGITGNTISVPVGSVISANGVAISPTGASCIGTITALSLQIPDESYSETVYASYGGWYTYTVGHTYTITQDTLIRITADATINT
jgi:hypothetical protein